MAALDLFVLSSITEGMPVVLLEAMAANLPVVSTAVGGVPALVRDDANGLLVPRGDPARLRAALTALLEDRERAARLGARGRALAEGFSLEQMEERYLALYRGATRRRR
jgi:glycosyltransferase involved in cell wall biosynthesis